MKEPRPSNKVGRFVRRVRGRVFTMLPVNIRAKVPWLRNGAQTTLEDGGVSGRPDSAGEKSVKHMPLPVSMPKGYGYYGPEASYDNTSTSHEAQTKAESEAAASGAALKRSDTTQTSTSSQTAITHAAAPSFSSTVAQHSVTSDANSTIRSRMPDAPYYNQSQMARQPSDAYDPSRRNVNRISELSSLSSGFGDGDIIVQAPPPLPEQQMQASIAAVMATAPSMSSMALPPDLHPLGAAPVNMSYSNNNSGDHISWTSNAQTAASLAPANGNGNGDRRRDTIYTEYTEHSEDLPPRFRTLSSWVNQQSSRVVRAQQAAQQAAAAGADAAGRSEGNGGAGGVYGLPPIPTGPFQLGVPGVNAGMPPEPNLNMMMADDEVPRRPESALNLITSVGPGVPGQDVSPTNGAGPYPYPR